VVDGGGPAVFYGPQPIDVSEGEDVGKADAYCEPAAYYGPPPCSSDQQCVEWYGPGWYCDEEYTMTDPCGQPVTWPMCEQTPQR